MKKNGFILCLFCFFVLLSRSASGFEMSGLRVRGGIGTDITGGLAFGGGVYSVQDLGNNGLELGILFFNSHSEETTEEFHTYDEETDVFVLGVGSNILLNYNLNKARPYFIVGFGIAIINVEWSEESKTDTSLGTPLSGGGSKQSVDATTVGSVLNFGIGQTFNSKYDLRFEIPIIIIPGAPGDSAAVVPAFTFTLGYML